MVDKKKRRTLPPRGLPTPKADPSAVDTLPDRPMRVSEDFGEATFAGAFNAVKAVLENAAAPPKAEKSDKAEKRRKK
jgi:hypothetical protein